MRGKDRPRIREWILKNGLRPHIEDGVWDGAWIEYPNGERAYMFGGTAKQMRRMASEGHWGVVPIRKRLWRRRTW
jgi:hypothetical protein